MLLLNDFTLIEIQICASDSFSRILALYKFVCMYVCMIDIDDVFDIV